MGCSDVYIVGAGSKLAVTCDKLWNGSAYVDPGSGTGDAQVILPFSSESFNPSGEDVSSNAITGGRTVLDKEILNKVMDGSLDIELIYEQFNYLMYMILGVAPASVTATGISSITGGGNIPNYLPKYDVAISHGGQITVTSLCNLVNSVTLNIAPNAYISMSMDMVSGGTYSSASGDGSIGTLSTATLISPSDLDTSESTLTIGSTSYDIIDNVSSLSLTFNNNIDTSANKLNGSGRMTAVPGFFNVTGSLTLQPNNGTSNFSASDLASLTLGTAITPINLAFTDGSNAVYLVISGGKITNLTHDVTGQGLLGVNVDFETVGVTNPVQYGVNTTTAGVSEAYPQE